MWDQDFPVCELAYWPESYHLSQHLRMYDWVLVQHSSCEYALVQVCWLAFILVYNRHFCLSCPVHDWLSENVPLLQSVIGLCCCLLMYTCLITCYKWLKFCICFAWLSRWQSAESERVILHSRACQVGTRSSKSSAYIKIQAGMPPVCNITTRSYPVHINTNQGWGQNTSLMCSFIV